MSQGPTANFYTFSSHDGIIKLKYYPHAPGPLIQGQSVGPRLEYQGPEGSFTYPDAGPGRQNVTMLDDSVLGPQINVVLIPTVDAKAVKLTLLLPPINTAGHQKIDFHTIAIKTTSYGLLPREGARLTYEVIHLQGKAECIALPHATLQEP
jgi:hypothetical protein